MAFRPLSVISAVRQPGDTEVTKPHRRADIRRRYPIGSRWPCFALCRQTSGSKVAIKLLSCVQDKAEERAQLANVNYIAARHWEALVESRKLCAQVSYQTGSRLVAPGLLASIAVNF